MRVVLDTNVVVSALLFERGHLAWVREAWVKGRITPLIDTPCADELVRVLAYPKFRLSADEVQALLANYLPYAETVDTGTATLGRLPRCRDPHDQIFLTLAEVGKARVLVTGDSALLELSGRIRFVIETPADFRHRSGL